MTPRLAAASVALVVVGGGAFGVLVLQPSDDDDTLDASPTPTASATATLAAGGAGGASDDAWGGTPAASPSSGDGGDGGAGGGGEPAAGRLDGAWDDAGRRVIITQNGAEVVGDFYHTYYCDLDSATRYTDEATPRPDARVATETRNFTATLDSGGDGSPGDTLTGELTTCRYGDESAGIEYSAVTFTIVDANTIEGVWTGSIGSGTVTLTRLEPFRLDGVWEDHLSSGGPALCSSRRTGRRSRCDTRPTMCASMKLICYRASNLATSTGRSVAMKTFYPATRSPARTWSV